MLAKLINQVVLTHRDVSTFVKMKKFLCLKIAEIDMDGQFCVEENDSGHNFLQLDPFSGG